MADLSFLTDQPKKTTTIDFLTDQPEISKTDISFLTDRPSPMPKKKSLPKELLGKEDIISKQFLTGLLSINPNVRKNVVSAMERGEDLNDLGVLKDTLTEGIKDVNTSAFARETIDQLVGNFGILKPTTIAALWGGGKIAGKVAEKAVTIPAFRRFAEKRLPTLLKRPLEKTAPKPEITPTMPLKPSEMAIEAPKVEEAIEGKKVAKWQYGAEPAAAIPGEPIAFYDIKKGNLATAKAQIIYDEVENEPLGYKIKFKNGQILQNPKSEKIGGSPYFETIEEAQKYTEQYLAKPEIIAPPGELLTAKEIALKGITPKGKIAIGTPIEKAITPLKFTPKRAGNINLTKFTPEVRPAIKQITKTTPEIVTRSKISNAKLLKMSSEMADTPIVKTITSLPEGRLEAEVLALRQGNDDLVRRTLGRELTELRTNIDPLLNQIKGSLEEQSKIAGTFGRGLQQFKIPTIAREKLIDMIDSKMAQLAKDPIYGKDKILLGKFKELRKIIGGKDFNPTIFDKAYEFWMNNILSGPWTHLVNTTSNLIFSLMKPFEKAAAVGIDIPASLITGKRTQYAREIPQLFRGALAAFRPSKKLPITKGTKLDIVRPPAIKGFMGKVIRIPTRLLVIEDNLQKRITGFMELYAGSERQAIQEGLKGSAIIARRNQLINAPGSKLMEQVSNEQLIGTFQKELGKAGNWIMSMRNVIPGARWIIPFIKTPANIMKESLRRTPFYAGRIGQKIIQKKITQEELTKDLGLLTLSGLTTATIAYQYFKGNIVGDAPKGQAERDAFYRQGKQPNSIKIGNKWIPFGRIEPLGTAMTTIVNLLQDYHESNKDLKQDKIMETISGLGRSLGDKTFLSGMFGAIRALDDPMRYGNQFISRFVTGFMPASATIRTIAQLTDKQLREQKGILPSVKAQIPGFLQTLPPRYTAFGEPIERKRFGPFESTIEKIDIVDKELNKLKKSIGFPGKTIAGKKLSDIEYRYYSKTSGNLIKQRLQELFRSPDYFKLDRFGREKEIDSIIRQSRDEVRDRLIRKD